MSHLLGILHGREETFPPALLAEINGRNTGTHAEALLLSSVEALERSPYRTLVDRISGRIPYYRSFVWQQRLLGVQCFPDPQLFALDRVGLAQLALRARVATPPTLLLPHNSHPPGVEAHDFANLAYPLPWEQYLHRVSLPGVLRSAELHTPTFSDGGRRIGFEPSPPQRFESLSELWHLYGRSGDRLQVIQPDLSEAQRILVLVAGQHLEALGYEPISGRHFPLAPELESKAVEATRRLLKSGVDLFLTGVEFAWHRSQPWLTDLQRYPDLDWWSLGEDSFTRVVRGCADELVRRTESPRKGR